MRRDDGRRTVITANGGSISTTTELDKLLLKLKNGRQLIVAASGERIDSLNFESFDLTVDLPALNIFRPRGAKAEESTFTEVAARLAAGGERTPLWLEDRAQFHWTLIHPLTFLAMPILAVAMGVTGRRRSSNLKPIAGVAILIVYHELLEEWGQVVAANGVLSPYLSMWGLLAAFMCLSVLLYVGSIEKARTAKAASRSDDDTIRLPSRVAATTRNGARRRAAS
jgi:lipopolysaccharide export system permease protein